MQIRQENKGLAEKAHVYPMTVDHVYDYLTQEPASARDVSFILVPQQREVKTALKLYDGANQTINSFRGVPVFQAEELSIDIEDRVRYFLHTMTRATVSLPLRVPLEHLQHSLCSL